MDLETSWLCFHFSVHLPLGAYRIKIRVRIYCRRWLGVRVSVQLVGRYIWASWGGLSSNIYLSLVFAEWPSFPFQVLRVQWGLCRQRQTVPRDPYHPLYLPLDLSKRGSSQPWEPWRSHGQLTVWVLCGADHNVSGVAAKSQWTSFLLFLQVWFCQGSHAEIQGRNMFVSPSAHETQALKVQCFIFSFLPCPPRCMGRKSWRWFRMSSAGSPWPPWLIRKSSLYMEASLIPLIWTCWRKFKGTK